MAIDEGPVNQPNKDLQVTNQNPNDPQGDIPPYVDRLGFDKPRDQDLGDPDVPKRGNPKSPPQPEHPTGDPPAPRPSGYGSIKVCCAGLNPEEAMLEAILRVTIGARDPNWTTIGSEITVAFYVRVGNPWIDCGTTTVRGFNGGFSTTLNFAVRKVLPPEAAAHIFLTKPEMDFRIIRCVVKSRWGSDDYQATIPFPQSSHWGKWKRIIRADRDTDPLAGQGWPVHAAALKNGKILFFAGGGRDDVSLFDPTNDTFQMGGPNGHEMEAWVEIQNKEKGVDYKITRESKTDPDDTEVIDGIIAVEGTPPKLVEDTSADRFFIRQKLYALSHNTFCSGHSLLADGRLFVAGGAVATAGRPDEYHFHHPIGPREVSIYDPDTSTWAAVSPMRNGRWYPSTIILGDGNVFIMDGHPGSDDELLSYEDDFDGGQPQHRHFNTDREIFLTKTGGWQFEPSVNASMGWGHNVIAEYPRIHLLPNGDIFCSSKIRILPRYERIDIQDDRYVRTTVPAEPFPEGITAIYKAANKKWEKLFEFPGGGTIGPDHKGTSVLLPLTFPHYAPRVMVFENMNAGDPGYYIIHPLDNNPSWQRQEDRLIIGNRESGSAVILPDGTIFFVGGLKRKDQDKPQLGMVPQLIPEIFDPFASENPWKLAAPLTRGRQYHSAALLMHDGRVFVGGGEPRHGSEKESASLHDFEIYTPDCLLRGPRPEFSIAAQKVSHGQRLAIKLGGDWRFKHLHPERIALIRCCTATHSFNYDQSYVNLQARKKLRRYVAGKYHIEENFYKRIEQAEAEPLEAPEPTDSEFEVVIPENPSLLPPGYYYLFLLSKLGDGTPGAASIAEFVCIQ